MLPSVLGPLLCAGPECGPRAVQHRRGVLSWCGGVLPGGRHLAMSGDIFSCQDREKGGAIPDIE